MAEKSIGALWTAGDDKKFSFSGSIDLPDGSKLKIIVFKISYKEGIASRPDYKIYKAKERGESQPKDAQMPDEISEVDPF